MFNLATTNFGSKGTLNNAKTAILAMGEQLKLPPIYFFRSPEIRIIHLLEKIKYYEGENFNYEGIINYE
ncbi:hypothetical protein BJP34_35065 [Moorena producens PAL-8-15-08-1]|uniref:Uncharacterized protein n=1 Tax=Moorena producens PAL-8-15-08-1 TaxID=1458985 RepID=A0A1D8U2M3_9CYAN|nr:hypothetical protein BJP34_35065 [Moorena producens PAL-8-15-08-1]